MSEWKSIALREITTKIGSGATPRGGKEAYGEEGIALIRSMNVRDEGFDYRNLARIDESQAARLNNVVVEADDVLLNITGASVARCCLAPHSVLPARVNQHVAIIRVRRDVADPRFVSACLTSHQGKSHLLAIASGGSTREALTKATLEDFEIRLPDITTQRRVGELLDAFDELIEINRRRVQVLEAMARAIYREWFVKFRYPGHEDVPLVDSTVGQIPDGWVVGTVSDLCLRLQAGGTPKRSEAAFWCDPEIDWYKTGDLNDSVLTGSSEQISSLAASRARMFAPDTILIAIYGATIGRLGLLERPASANQAALGLVADQGVSTTEHLWFVLEDLRSHFISIAQGAAQQNVSKEKVAGAPVTKPPRALVDAFTERAGTPWRLSHSLQKQGESLSRIRDLLLPKLVTGQIDVSDLDLDVLIEGAMA